MGARAEYFEDLLRQCKQLLQNAEIPEEDEGIVMAALIISDGLNGLRKALLQSHNDTGR